MFVVAHISDLHFNGTRFNRSRIESTLSYINARAAGIDVLLVTGDIADEGAPSEYREAHGVLESPLPMLITAGNHDVREPFSAALIGTETSGPINHARRISGRDGLDVLFLMCDSSIPGRNDGYLDDATIGWLSDQLDAEDPATPVFIAFHHPPAKLHMPFMDSIRQTGEERLAALVGQHPNVVAFLCGHAHTPAVTVFADRPLCLAPGVSSTLSLPFEGREIVNRGQPPGIAFHLYDDGQLVTHFRSVMF
ncbi:metallophosphoesterase [Gordonia sp. zg691]|uniref:Metallophosphoesterase n=1 Tax=Gordonia jinghuaiqii TaxID=2758710 RepID=A0A7D7QGF7_9ACTN|nr:metallophosphoesterase [Gordonia jinghuaiqii]MBD0860594.1 metallophosphoesterase [Gordonia jinghuaiqii]MCR5978141.1 metallophosphoesterase [Gordonia jinghuaiqii]QMT01402.1 metallophosphoesterase [Gordonia jinghuaiqii]